MNRRKVKPIKFDRLPFNESPNFSSSSNLGRTERKRTFERKRTYTWDSLIPVSGAIIESKRVPSKVFDDCDVYISLIGKGNSYGPYFCDITIKTTTHIAVNVDIVLSLTNIKKEEKSLTNWGVNPCTFSGWSLPADWSSNKEYNFICQVTWMIPDPIPRPHFNFHNRLKKFLMSSSYYDVKIVIGTEVLHAHKIILASCSNVFDSMLTAPMKEAAENEIIIKDIGLNVMKTVLTFLYAGEEKALDDLPMALGCLEAAEKYEIQDLKELCEHKLCKYINVRSIVTILSDSDTHRAEKLKKECLLFIAENKAIIIPKPSFQGMCAAKPHLMVQLMATLITDL